MHFCTAFVALSGDDQQVVFRGLHAPLSWPEIEVIRHMHGDDAVREVHPFVMVEQQPRAEKERLGLIYGEIVDKEIFPGRNPVMEMDAAETDPMPAGTLWHNPITGMAQGIPVPDDYAPPAAADTTPAYMKNKKRSASGTFTKATPEPVSDVSDAD